jgi:hypothetical protein
MFRKSVVHILVGALFLSFIGALSVAAQAKEEITAAYTANVKKRIVKLGTGSDAKVRVKLQDKTKLKGYVSKIAEDSFVVTDPKTNAETTVSYPNVTELKAKMSTGEIIAVSAVAAVGAFFLIGFIVSRHVD